MQRWYRIALTFLYILSNLHTTLFAALQASVFRTRSPQDVVRMDPKFSGEPRCYTEANKATGTFTFAGVSSGKYRVVPHFNNKAIKFHIKPEAMEFELGRDSLRLPESYKVTRFSVGGRVLQTVDGPGMRNAKIKMNGKEVATTGSDGKYTLDNIHASTYTIQVTADDMQFKDHIAKISLRNPALPDVVVTGFKTVPDKPIITKVRDLTADLTEILDHAQTPDRVVSEKLQSALDPRSPSVFLRTPLVLDESNASNISLRGSSIEYEEIDSEGDLSFKDCSTTVAPATESIGGSGSIFSDTSLNTELKADIDCIIQKLYDAGGKDPRSPSVAILRTPIVFQENEEGTNEEQGENPIENEQPLVPQEETKEDAHEEEKTTTTKLTIVLQDENTITGTPAVDTPKREKSDLGSRKAIGLVGSRTPLGCVTNVQTMVANSAGGTDMLKTALLGQMKQGAAAGLANSAELIPGRKAQPRSKIPTFLMK